tara:strand:- start:1124 stop:1348 length:225 start_codon:yes stop_codon:yes gene_type:complete
MKHDPVDKPQHYNQGSIECLDAIESMLTAEEFKGYCKGNIIKYVWRENYKDQNIQDLKKSNFFLNRLIDKLENL